MTTQNIFPALRYRDGERALTWLIQAFGFKEHAIHRSPGGQIHHAELRLGESLIMFGEEADIAPEPDRRHSIYVTISNPDEHCSSARAAGAEITREPYDTTYNTREYSALDIEGNSWSFGTYDPYSPPDDA